MWFVPVLIVFVIFLVLFFIFYRFRKPDQIVLIEKSGVVQIRKARFYPRQLCLVIPNTIYSRIAKIEGEARGRILLNIQVAFSAVPSLDYLAELIRVGGWKNDAVITASKEFEITLQAAVKEYLEKYEIEDINSEKLTQHIHNRLTTVPQKLGLEIVSLNVQSIDPADEDIAKAIQQRETARIMEQTEIANQNAKVNARKAQIDAGEKIALAEHELELKKIKLKKELEEKEAEIASYRVQQELKRRTMQFEFDQKEIEVLKDNPNLLILSPQLTRLAEASQNLRNAKTVVNLTAADIAQGTSVLSVIQNFLQDLLEKQKPGKGKK